MNSLTLTGNLGKDSETRFMSDGKAVVSFSVADSQGKEKPSIWWNCSWFGDRAQKTSPYLLKGQQVTVVGSVTEREYTNKEGQKVKAMDVRVNDLALQGGKREESNAAPSAPRPQSAAPKPAPRSAGSSGFADMDDDIPFRDPMKSRAFALAI